jgi:hypothetical protein
LNALLEDFSRIEVICEVSRDGSIFQIETNCLILPADLQAIINPILKSEIMNNLRFVSLLEKFSTLENMA